MILDYYRERAVKHLEEIEKLKSEAEFKNKMMEMFKVTHDGFVQILLDACKHGKKSQKLKWWKESYDKMKEREKDKENEN